MLGELVIECRQQIEAGLRAVHRCNGDGAVERDDRIGGGAAYAYVTLDAAVVKCREGGRTVNVCVVHAVGVNRDGFREPLGLTSSLPKAAPPGSRTCVHSPRAASPASSWSARTRTPASSTRSPRPDWRELAALPHPLHA